MSQQISMSIEMNNKPWKSEGWLKMNPQTLNTVD